MSETDDHKKRLDNIPQPIFFAKKAFEGKNSEIREHHYPDGSRFVVTRLGSRKGGFSFEDAHTVAKRVQKYYDELKGCGIPVPPLSQLYVEYEPSIDRSVVVKSSPWVGNELYSIIRNADEEKDAARIEMLVRGIARILASLYAHRIDEWHTTVGIDPHTSNFVVDDKGVVSYVDLFPPRLHENGVPLVEWPAPKTEAGFQLGYFKHFDIRGIVLTALQHLSRAKPKLSDYFKELILAELREVMPTEPYERFVDELMQVPFMRTRELIGVHGPKHEAVRDVITTASSALLFETPYAASAFREIALALATHDLMSEQDIDAFFLTSHCEDTLSEATIAELITILETALSRR